MRRLFAAAILCAAFLLLTGVAAAAPGLLHPAGNTREPARAPLAKARVDRAPYRFEPLARSLTGSGTISLNVYTYDGTPEVGANVGWWVFGDTDYGFGTGATDDAGHVDMYGVPAATADNGEIAVFADDDASTMYDLWGLSWGASGWTGGLQPGRLPVTLVRSTDKNWNNWDYARARLWSQQGAETHLARSDIARAAETTSGYAATITTGPEQLSAGTIYFWDDEGMELSSVNGTAVSPGTTAGPGLSVRQADAQRVWMDYWGSGKPGTSTWLIMNNFPAGWTNAITGVAGWPQTAASRSFGSATSTGAKNTVKRITIPSGAAPGYAYWVWADHQDGTLSLVTSFQTCTLKPSKASVRKGAAITLSGVVPIKGHEGSTKGTRKYVTIYKTTSSKLAKKGQPAKSGGASRVAGWTKVAKVRTDGLGKYRKASIRPTRTTWYAAWYPGDSWYWGAWTSLARVTVR